MKMKTLTILALVINLSGCVSLDQTLVNDKGAQYHCKQQGFGLIGALMASSNNDDCIKEANSKGYK